MLVEVVKIDGKLVYIQPNTKKVIPAPDGAKLGQKIDVYPGDLPDAEEAEPEKPTLPWRGKCGCGCEQVLE